MNEYDTKKYYNETLEQLKNRVSKRVYEMIENLEPLGIIPFESNVIFKIRNNTYNNPDIDTVICEFGLLNKDFCENEFICLAFNVGDGARAGYTDYFIFEFDEAESIIMGFELDEEAE